MKYEITLDLEKKAGRGAGKRSARAWVVEANSLVEARHLARTQAQRHYIVLNTINWRVLN